MSWVTVIWSMVPAACLTLAAMHFRIWCKNRRTWVSLAFVWTAVAAAGTASGELKIMSAATPGEIGLAIRYTYVAVAMLVVGLVAFVQMGFGSGRLWLGWTTVTFQASALLLNFTSGVNIIFSDIAAVEQIEFLGEPVSIVTRAAGNPWIILDQLTALSLCAFVVDATVRLWRGGGADDRRKAWRLGGSIIGFLLVAVGYSAFVDAQVIRSPYMISFPFLAIVLAMGFELSRDLMRSDELVRELRSSESHLLASRTELDEQLRFERLVTEISATLMHAPAAEVERKTIAAMGRVAELLGFEIAVYSLLFGEGTGLVAYIWNKPGTPGMPSDLTEKDFPWKARELSAGRDTHIRTINDFPPEAAVDQATYERYGIKSSFDVSIIVGGRAVGVFSLGSFEKEQTVPPEIVQRQRIVGDLFANAILRAQSETALRESERRLELAAAAANMGLWWWNMTDNTMWATDRAKELFGLAPETDLTFGTWLERLHPEDMPSVKATLDTAIASGDVYEAEYRIFRSDGETRWIAARGETTYDTAGEPSSMTGVVLDITARQQARMEAEEFRRDLAHAGRVTLLGQLASALAHELGQPLGAILRNAEAAELILRETLPDLEELHAIITDIRADDQRASNVISRLRSLLKRGSVDSQPVQLAGVIQEVVSLVRSEALARNVKLHVVDETELQPVLADRVHLQQVLLNLIVNAMDAMNCIGATRREVMIRSTPDSTDSDLIEVSLSDSGSGIPPDVLNRLFEPFFTTKESGMGMGLAVSRTIIEAHGGRLRAENRPEGGAVFRFTVPVAKPLPPTGA